MAGTRLPLGIPPQERTLPWLRLQLRGRPSGTGIHASYTHGDWRNGQCGPQASRPNEDPKGPHSNCHDTPQVSTPRRPCRPCVLPWVLCWKPAGLGCPPPPDTEMLSRGLGAAGGKRAPGGLWAEHWGQDPGNRGPLGCPAGRRGVGAKGGSSKRDGTVTRTRGMMSTRQVLDPGPPCVAPPPVQRAAGTSGYS